MKKKLLLLTVLLVSGSTFAEGGEQPPGVPVDQYMIFATVIAISIAVIFFAKKKEYAKKT